MNSPRQLLRAIYHGYLRKPARYALSSALQHLPIPSDILGPPKRIAPNSAEWAAAYNAENPPVPAQFLPLHPAETLHHCRLRSLELDETFFRCYAIGLEAPKIERSAAAGGYFTTLAPTFAASIPNGRVCGTDGLVLTPDDALLEDVSQEFRFNRWIKAKPDIMTVLRLPPKTVLRGRVAVLATRGAQHYFAHWMMDLLPRAGLLQAAGYGPDSIDWYYISPLDAPYKKETLVRLGLPLAKIVSSGEHPLVQADELIVPSPVSGVFAASRATCEFLRSMFGDAVSQSPPDRLAPPRRYYISRAAAGHRRVVNEADVLAALRKRGFTSIEPQKLPLSEQTSLFAHADAIVAPLGSALSNYVFCRPGTKLIELLNPLAVQACTWAICSQLGMEYYWMLTPGVGQAEVGLQDDVIVDVERMEATLDIAGIG